MQGILCGVAGRMVGEPEIFIPTQPLHARAQSVQVMKVALEHASVRVLIEA
jgi:hypothetical protein